MSSSSNPIQWTWPLPGEDTPPYAVESNFGPVSKNDSIVLTFTPASYTGTLTLYCSWQNGQQGITWKIYNNGGSPFTYNFNETTPNSGDTNDIHICHFLQPTNEGNTQTFQYQNTPAKAPILWQQSGASVLVPSTSAKPGSGPTSEPAPASAAVTASTTHGLSVGAAVGITIGIVALLLALGVLGFLARRRTRRRRQQAQKSLSPPAEWRCGDTPPPMTAYAAHNWGGPKDAYYAPQADALPWAKRFSTKRVAELDGAQTRAEVDGMHPALPPPAYPSELSGEGGHTQRAELLGE